MTLPTVDETYRALLKETPPRLRLLAELLPWQIGIAREPAEGWESFWILDPNRHPARYLSGLSEAEQRAVDQAHHRAVFFGLLFDRLADRQVAPAPHLLALRGHFLRAWERSLCALLGGAAEARRVMARALSALRAGTASERLCWRQRALSAETYATQTRDKLRWCGATPVAWLARSEADRAAVLERCYDLFGMTVQMTDDAVDGAEDLRTVGVSRPLLLGVQPGALLHAARATLHRATGLAWAGGFDELARWFERFDAFLIHARGGGDLTQERTEGARLGARLVEVL